MQGRRAPRIEHLDCAQLLRVVVRQRCDDLRIAADGDGHRSVGRPQLAQEGLGCALRQTQRLTGHAPTAVDPEHDGQRELPRRKRGNLLRFLILLDLEVLALQTGHQPAIGVGHRGIHLDQLHP